MQLNPDITISYQSQVFRITSAIGSGSMHDVLFIIRPSFDCF